MSIHPYRISLQENFHSLMDLTESARNAYTEMVQALNKEQEENPNKQSGSHPPYYAHMGHSRTPSACSAISFTSSILSEPISENYPQSEPETDSRGYEIIREALIRDSAHDGMGGNVQDIAGGSGIHHRGHAGQVELLSPSEKITIVESLDDIDEGREDSHDLIRMKKDLRAESDGDDGDDEDEDEDESDSGSVTSRNDDETEYDRDTVRELPHIDSIHSSVVDLSTEILSQHSSKTLDLNTDVLSTHSSKAPGDNAALGASATANSNNPSADPSAEQNQTNPGSANNNSAHKMRPLDTERIESWVAEAQQHIERLSVHPNGDDFSCANLGLDTTGKSNVKTDALKENSHDVGGRGVCDRKPQSS